MNYDIKRDGKVTDVVVLCDYIPRFEFTVTYVDFSVMGLTGAGKSTVRLFELGRQLYFTYLGSRSLLTTYLDETS